MSYYLILKFPIEPDHYIDIKNNFIVETKTYFSYNHIHIERNKYMFNFYIQIKIHPGHKVYKSVISLTRPPQWNPPRSFDYQL